MSKDKDLDKSFENIHAALDRATRILKELLESVDAKEKTGAPKLTLVKSIGTEIHEKRGTD